MAGIRAVDAARAALVWCAMACATHGQDIYGTPAPGAQIVGQHGTNGASDYWLYLPTNYKAKGAGAASPMIFCLGGAGELSDMTTVVPNAGSGYPPTLCYCSGDQGCGLNDDRYKFLHDNWIVVATPGGSVDPIAKTVDYVIANYNVNVNQVYFTALCMGCNILMPLALARPNVPAAIALFSANLSEFTQWSDLAQLKNIPFLLQAYRNDNGGSDFSSNSERLAQALISDGAREVDTGGTYEGSSYGFFDEFGHDCWSCGMIDAFQYCAQPLYDFLQARAKNATGVRGDSHNSNLTIVRNSRTTPYSLFCGLDGRLMNVKPAGSLIVLGHDRTTDESRLMIETGAAAR